jgi:chloramphenicol-sensitive protein RarD
MSAVTASSVHPEARRGLFATVGAFFIWGLFPIYWRALAEVPSLQIIAHRIAWCGVFVIGYLLVRRGTAWIGLLLRRPRLLRLLAVSAVLISMNWGLYIWAVNAGHIVETSLGYFINPLVNVLLGVLVLQERLNPRQWLAVAIALAGVVYLTWMGGRLPWIALLLALSFGTYGLLRKIAEVDPIEGLAVESAYVMLPGVAFLVWLGATGRGAFGHIPLYQELLLVLGGVVTAIPLIWFAYGARRISYSTVGIVQYLGPTLQLLSGVLLFGEPFNPERAIGFICIWSALGIYALDGFWRLRMRGHG